MNKEIKQYLERYRDRRVDDLNMAKSAKSKNVDKIQADVNRLSDIIEENDEE